jgi:hypothetical protein
MDGTYLAEGFDRNQRIILAQTDKMTHAESLAQSPYRINCMNWVLGHIADGRDNLLELLGRHRVMDEADASRYRRESEPITEDGSDVLPLEELLHLLHEAQQELSAALSEMTPEDLAVEKEWMGHTAPLAYWAHFFYFHDTYHTGQTDLLRQVAGKNDKVI